VLPTINRVPVCSSCFKQGRRRIRHAFI
jgi:hypothetical protein